MRRLPNGKPISALGFGCSSLWARPSFDERTAQAVLGSALQGGINHFDTASSYGMGTGERRLGEFLRGRAPSDFVISTKIGGNFLDGGIVRSFAPEIAERSLTESLRRLGLDRVDVLYLHGPSISELTDELMRYLELEKARGRIVYSGMESKHLDRFDQMCALPLDVAMLHYNVVDQRADDLIRRLHSAGKIIISGTALAQSGFDLKTFLPKSRESAWYLLRKLKNQPLFWLSDPIIGRKLNRLRETPQAAALAFVASHPLITSALFGSRSPDHVLSNAKAGQHPLRPQERAALLSPR